MGTTTSNISKLSVIEAVTQFVEGTGENWNDVTVPIPDGMFVIATDTTDVKVGDGVTLYPALPVLFNLNNLVSAYLTYGDTIRNERIRLSGPTTYYINAATGSDVTGDGTSAKPWATPTYAHTWLQANIDTRGNRVTLNLASGNFGSFYIDGILVGQSSPYDYWVVGSGDGTVLGASAPNQAALLLHKGAMCYIANLKIENPSTIYTPFGSSGVGIESIDHSYLILGNDVTLGDCGLYQMYTSTSGVIYPNGYDIPISVSGNAQCMLFVDSNSYASINKMHITFTAPVTYSGEMVATAPLGRLDAVGVTFNNPENVTGKRYYTNPLSIILTNGAGPNYFPGTVPGQSAILSQYL